MWRRQLKQKFLNRQAEKNDKKKQKHKKLINNERDLDDWLTVHRSITLVDLQLHVQKFLFIYIQYIY